MNDAKSPELSPVWRRKHLAARYALLVFLVTGIGLTLNAAVGAWFIWQQQRELVAGIQAERVAAAAERIRFFVENIEMRLRWIIDAPWLMQDVEERQIDARRQVRAAAAISELAWVEASGREVFSISRIGQDRGEGTRSWADIPEFMEAKAKGIAFGPVYFIDQSEPYFRIALAGQGTTGDVVVAVVNLKSIWDIITGIRIGESGRAYVVDSAGRLVAHPDISLVLKNTSMAMLDQVRSGLGQEMPGAQRRTEPVRDGAGMSVLAATYRLTPPGWVVIAELPIAEAYAPVFSALRLNLVVLALGLALAVAASVLMARRMVGPIRALQAGAARIGEGALDHRIEVRTRDELGELGRRFNAMAESLQISYATLESRVRERTAELAEANEAKSRFFAAASHDLRQPLHALALFFGQMREERDPARRARVADKLGRAIETMNGLFDALLDMSRLNSGVVEPEMRPLPLQGILDRLEAGFRLEAEQKGLRLVIPPCPHWVESDALLLERILRNLIGNAIRYTEQGRVTVEARPEGSRIVLSVEDTGIGMSGKQQLKAFDEFYRAAGSRRGDGGFGLGLAIVHRLVSLLGGEIALQSAPGQGTTFRFSIPKTAPLPLVPPPGHQPVPALPGNIFGRGRRALVVDDDPVALDALAALLDMWGFDVTAAAGPATVPRAEDPFDLVIADYHLGEGTGLDLLAALDPGRREGAATIIISGSADAGIRQAVEAKGLVFLRKPVQPLTLRRMILDFGGASRSIEPAISVRAVAD